MFFENFVNFSVKIHFIFHVLLATQNFFENRAALSPYFSSIFHGLRPSSVASGGGSRVAGKLRGVLRAGHAGRSGKVGVVTGLAVHVLSAKTCTGASGRFF